MYTVYCHINKANGKRYVGMTGTSVKKRWGNGSRYKHNDVLWNDILAFGWDGFEHVVLAEGLSKTAAAQTETEYIRRWDTTSPANGYNISLGVSTLGTHQTDDAKRRISDKLKGRVFSDEHRRHLSEKKAGANHHLARKVAQYDKTGNLVRVWEYMSEAAVNLGINKSSITAVCRSKRPSAGGYVWRYVEG